MISEARRLSRCGEKPPPGCRRGKTLPRRCTGKAALVPASVPASRPESLFSQTGFCAQNPIPTSRADTQSDGSREIQPESAKVEISLARGAVAALRGGVAEGCPPQMEERKTLGASARRKAFLRPDAPSPHSLLSTLEKGCQIGQHTQSTRTKSGHKQSGRAQGVLLSSWIGPRFQVNVHGVSCECGKPFSRSSKMART